MKSSLKTKVIIFITLLFIAISFAQFRAWFKDEFLSSSELIEPKNMSTKVIDVTSDPIVMYQNGVKSLKKMDYVSAYVWYKLSSEQIRAWAEATSGKKGEDKFNDSYNVMDVFKVKDEVETNYPLIYNSLSKQERQFAEVELQRRRYEISNRQK